MVKPLIIHLQTWASILFFKRRSRFSFQNMPKKIWLFEILNYPNRTESDFLISDDISIRLFSIPSFTSSDTSSHKILPLVQYILQSQLTSKVIFWWRIVLFEYLTLDSKNFGIEKMNERENPGIRYFNTLIFIA